MSSKKLTKFVATILALSMLLVTLPLVTAPASAVIDPTSKSVYDLEELQDALNNKDVTTIIIPYVDDVFIFEIPQGTTITIENGITLLVEGLLENHGVIKIDNGGVIDICNKGIIYHYSYGEIFNEGVLNVCKEGAIYIAQLFCNVEGVICNRGLISISYKVYNELGIIDNWGTITFDSGGTIENSNGGQITNIGGLINCATDLNVNSEFIFNYDGEIYNDCGGRILCMISGDQSVERGHKYDDGVTIAATYETDGSKICTCLICGHKDLEVIPKLDKIVSIGGVEISFDIINDVVVLKPSQQQMAAILNSPDKVVTFDFTGQTSVELYAGAGWFKDADKTITIVTDKGAVSVNTKSLWNNSGKTRLIIVENGKLDFKNL
jgi:hypothetical protein